MKVGSSKFLRQFDLEGVSQRGAGVEMGCKDSKPAPGDELDGSFSQIHNGQLTHGNFEMTTGMLHD